MVEWLNNSLNLVIIGLLGVPEVELEDSRKEKNSYFKMRKGSKDDS